MVSKVSDDVLGHLLKRMMEINPSLPEGVTYECLTEMAKLSIRTYLESEQELIYRQIPLLDHGHVRLVDSMGDDLSVTRAARASYAEEWKAGEDEGSDARLINYLWKHRHTTPFESVTFTFDVKAPIFVFRQWHRHRTQSYNELSARYRPLPNEFYIPNPEHVGVQSKNNKQGRDLTATDVLNEDYRARVEQCEALRMECENAHDLYQRLLAAGWPKELARAGLPVNTYSHMFTTMNLLNCLKFLTLRCDSHAQYEIRVYADAMRELIKPIVPVVLAAWEKGAWNAQ